MSCEICNGNRHSHFVGSRCNDCLQVRELVLASAPGTLVLIVDGSIENAPDGVRPTKCGYIGPAGAGLVLARAHDEAVVAVCAAQFECQTNVEAEYEAIVRGLMWAPVGIAWSDCDGAIAMARDDGHDAHFLPTEMRDPLHNLAHRLANAARKRDDERLGRIWIPTERW